MRVRRTSSRRATNAAIMRSGGSYLAANVLSAVTAGVSLLVAPMSGAAAPVSVAAVSAAGAPEGMEEVVVEGRHEGPRMWIVRSGDHTLWILGTISPLPKKMVWQPDAVEEDLHVAQELGAAWPNCGIDANPITALRVYIDRRHQHKTPIKLEVN